MYEIRELVKRILPSSIRRIVRACLEYVFRIGRWGIILLQVRGASMTDFLKLFLSAMLSPILSLKNVFEWQDPVLLFDTNVCVPGIGQFHLRSHSDDLWHVLPWRERKLVREIRNRLDEGGVFVDAGANIGVYSILASKLVGNDGRVIAIEMIPKTAAILRKHVELNGCNNIFVVENALSSTNGMVVTATVPVGKYGQASISPSRTYAESEEITITTTTIDDICQEYTSVELMKMDLEGAEAQALEGARDTLSRTSALIFETAFPQSSVVCEKLLADGFKMHALSNRDQLAVR